MVSTYKNKVAKPQATRLLSDLPGFTPQPMPKVGKYGGVLSLPKSKATGFFRTEKSDGRWWLIDPDGHRMLNAGVTSTNLPKLSPKTKPIFEQNFRDAAGWAEATRQFLFSNGFDGTGSWSEDGPLADTTGRRPVRAKLVSFMVGYGKVRGGTFAEPGHTGFPKKSIFAFDPQFETFCETFAKEQLTPTKDDPYLIGYFSDNEIPFPLDSLDRFLTLKEGDPNRVAADELVKSRNANPAALTDEDRQAWMEKLAERYFGVVSRAIRKADPNHMYLGSRLYSTDHRNEALLKAVGRHVDVMSYNLYNVWTPNQDKLDTWEKLTGRPVIITEFYAKGADSGLNNSDGAGWVVPTQKDRGHFYQNFVSGLIESGSVVGWHWFRYIDNDPDVGGGVNPNDSNKGLLMRDFKPYTPLLEQVKLVNESRYALAAYFDARGKTD